MAYRILAIDDDPGILRLIQNILNLSEYEVVTRRSVEEINLCDFSSFDLILLDIMMPLSGLDICRHIREDIHVPIIFITAKDREENMIEGINAGADDYITKPFTVKELLARVKMHLRREERHKNKESLLRSGELVINPDLQAAFAGNHKIAFIKKEFLILQLLAMNPNKIFSIEEIYDRIYPQSSNTQFRSISEFIYQIRSKLQPYEINPIETIWGGGYRWKAD